MVFWPRELSEQILQEVNVCQILNHCGLKIIIFGPVILSGFLLLFLLWLFYVMIQISCRLASSPSSWPGTGEEMLQKQKTCCKTFLFLMPFLICSGDQVESSTAGSVLQVMGTLWNTTWRTTSLLIASMISFNTTRRPTCDVLNLSCVWLMLCLIPALMRLKSTYRRRQAPGLLRQCPLYCFRWCWIFA